MMLDGFIGIAVPVWKGPVLPGLPLPGGRPGLDFRGREHGQLVGPGYCHDPGAVRSVAAVPPIVGAATAGFSTPGTLAGAAQGSWGSS